MFVGTLYLFRQMLSRVSEAYHPRKLEEIRGQVPWTMISILGKQMMMIACNFSGNALFANILPVASSPLTTQLTSKLARRTLVPLDELS